MRRSETIRKEAADMNHVDIVKNEWLAGYQLLVARVWATYDDVEIERIDEAEPWSEEIINRLRADFSNGDSASFVGSLHEHLRGDYLFATQPHDDAHCPFQQARIPLRASSPSGVVA